MRIPYHEVQDLLKRLIDEGDPDEVAMMFETFSRVKVGSAHYDSFTEEIDYEVDPEYSQFDWF